MSAGRLRPSTHPRYQFAHDSLREYAQEREDVADPEFRNRIRRWAEHWRDRGWPTSTDVAATTPRYLLDTYSATLTDEPSWLAALVTDPAWVDAAIQSVGVDRVLAYLRRAAAAALTHAAVTSMLAVVRGQAHALSPADPLAQPGYVLRQLWLQAAEFAKDRLADQIRTRLQSQPAELVPRWTTRRVSRLLLRETGRHREGAPAMAVLPVRDKETA